MNDELERIRVQLGACKALYAAEVETVYRVVQERDELIADMKQLEIEKQASSNNFDWMLRKAAFYQVQNDDLRKRVSELEAELLWARRRGRTSDGEE